jgi:pilus assembly protein FimV
VVDQYNENQYDDDLTVGAGEYEEYDPSEAVDLFEFSDQEESPTSRLKSLILSIDWEITDEVLMQFNEELIYLEGLWRGEKINLVYVQALQKISKYIYQQKADSHPNAIKLLLKFYYNLEKIISSDDLSGEQKKEILLEDVKRFESLKRQIARQTREQGLSEGEDEGQSLVEPQVNENELLNLKATVLGIDWEITEEDLNDLRQEVVRLEDKYAESRPKLILLQGIGTLGTYIKVHKNNAHGDAFKLLHLFFESLEKIVKTPMSLEEEKAVLFPAIEKFNSFKALLGPTVSSGTTQDTEEDGDEEYAALTEEDAVSAENTGEFQPALADFQEEDSRGFQEEEEARGLGTDGVIDVSSHIDQFFGESEEDVVSQETDEPSIFHAVEEDIEIQDVDATELDDTTSGAAEPEDAPPPPASADDVAEDEPGSSGLTFPVDKEVALQGVDVETEGDDDSDEAALPIEDSGILAPALGDGDEASMYSADSLSSSPDEGSVDEKIFEKLDDFFVDEVPGAETVVDPEYDLEAERDETPSVVEEELQITGEGIGFDDEEPGVEPVIEPEYAFEIEGDEASFEIEGEDLLADEVDAVFDDEESVVEPVHEPDYGLDAEIDEPSLEVEGEQITDEVEVIDDLATEVDRNLDAFFGLDQGVEDAESESEVDGLKTDDEEEVVFELVTFPTEEEAASLDVSPDSIQTVGQYIDSIGPGFNEKIIRRLGSEIDQLQQQWSAKSLEKSFLQLLSTITQHIERCRADSDPGAYELLKSNYDALSLLDEGTLDQNQEVLHREISKVLKWQQDLLFKQVTLK